jgi:DNA-binding NtrC family response regulator
MQRVGSSRVTFVNVRMISATNADLAAEVEHVRFREDLLYRLNTVVIHLPPLRERPEDIPPLAEHYLARFAAKYGRAFQGFDPAAMDAIRAHLWPGNVRELGHAIERAVLMADSPKISVSALGISASAPSTSADEMTLEQVEKLFIQKVLARHGGDVRKAAEQLGMSRSALYRRLQQFGL